MIFPIYPPRNRAVDLTKTLAILGVLLIHITAPGLSRFEAGSNAWLSCLFWNALSRGAVPLFLMASGALLLPPERELSLKKLYTRNFPRLLAALFFWAAAYKLYVLNLEDRLTSAALIRAAKQLLLFRHAEHLYYLHVMLLVYAFLPVTRLIAKHADRRLSGYLLGLWFLLGILYPTMRGLWPVTLLTGIPVQWRMNTAYASIGYTLLGFRLSAFRARRRVLWAVPLAAGFLITFFGTWTLSAADGALNGRFLEGMGLGPFLTAVGIFGLSSAPAGRGGRALAFLSKASFCVFLIHIFFCWSFSHAGLDIFSGPPLWTAPLLALLVLGCSCGVYAALSRIPGVRRWLI